MKNSLQNFEFIFQKLGKMKNSLQNYGGLAHYPHRPRLAQYLQGVGGCYTFWHGYCLHYFFIFFAFLLLTARQKSPIVFLRTAAKGAAGRAALRGGHCAHMHLNTVEVLTMAKRTNSTTTNSTNSTIMAAAQRVAARRTAADHKIMTAKAVRPVLQDARLVRTGGNAANGLLAIGGASLVINNALAQQQGTTVGTLLPAVAACPRVSNAIGKTSDHLQNCLAYSAKARLAVCGIWAALRSAGLVTTDGQATVPALCVDGKAVPSMTRKQLSALPGTAVLASPLLAAIAALTTGKPVPAWVKATLPGTDKVTPKKTTKASKAIA